jgi:hypothetical protein
MNAHKHTGERRPSFRALDFGSHCEDAQVSEHWLREVDRVIYADIKHGMERVVRAMRRDGSTNQEVRDGFRLLCEHWMRQGEFGRSIARLIYLTVERCLVKPPGQEVESEIASDKLVGLG